MDEQLRRLRESMLEIGCGQAEIAEAERLFCTASRAELTKHLKKCRCALLEEMHECGRRVDRMDQLIRRSEHMTK